MITQAMIEQVERSRPDPDPSRDPDVYPEGGPADIEPLGYGELSNTILPGVGGMFLG